MKQKFRTLVSLMLVVCLFAAFGSAACAAGGSQNYPSFGNPTTTTTPSSPVYRVIVEEGQKDQILPDRSSAAAGVTVTVKLAEGVSASEIRMTDKDGNPIDFKQVDESTYTFVMPAKDVYVSGTLSDLRLNADDHFAYIQGYPDGTFKPEGGLTRAEAASIFYRLLVNTAVEKSVSFTDVADGLWYTDAVRTLAGKGVITGYPDGSFRPNGSVTRAEFCAMASRFFTLESGSLRFTDVAESFWGYRYIASVVAHGWMTDSETAYAPNAPITRAEVVGIVNRMLKRCADETYLKRAENVKRFGDVPADASFYLDVMEAANGHNFIGAGTDETWTGLK